MALFSGVFLLPGSPSSYERLLTRRPHFPRLPPPLMSLSQVWETKTHETAKRGSQKNKLPSSLRLRESFTKPPRPRPRSSNALQRVSSLPSAFPRTTPLLVPFLIIPDSAPSQHNRASPTVAYARVRAIRRKLAQGSSSWKNSLRGRLLAGYSVYCPRAHLSHHHRL